LTHHYTRIFYNYYLLTYIIQVDVKAYDLGEPQLSSVTSVTIFVRRVTTPIPELGMGFSDDSYSARVLESAVAGTLVKVLTVVHPRPSLPLPLVCTIVSGNSEGKVLYRRQELRIFNKKELLINIK